MWLLTTERIFKKKKKKYVNILLMIFSQQLSDHFAIFTSAFLIKTKLKIVGNL